MSAGPVESALYGVQTISGQSWLRAHRVTVTNPYLGQPKITFDEERIREVEGVRTTAPTGVLSMNVDLAAPIDLYDPSTGLPLGQQMTQQDVYVALYSVYRALAAARDGA